MHNYVMVDLETLSLSPMPYICSIGAVSFNVNGIHGEFYRNVRREIQPDADIDLSTVAWWMSQPDEARAEILTEDGMSLTSALIQFIDFIEEVKPYKIFSNGATADLVWLKNAISVNGLVCPWSHFQEACFRTLRDLAPLDINPRSTGVAHHALHDAKSQAEHLISIAKTYSLVL